MATTEIEPYVPAVAPAEPSRLWRPTADPGKTVPPVEVDTRGALAFGVAAGGFVSLVAALAGALYYRKAGDAQGVDLALALAFVAFLTSLLAGHAHQRARVVRRQP